MPKLTFSEAELLEITKKYIKTVQRDPAKLPNIQDIVIEAFHKIAPKKEVEHTDVAAVIKQLKRRPTISDAVITEVAKKVHVDSLMGELRHSIGRRMAMLKQPAKRNDIDAIIQQYNLDPETSSLAAIRNAVDDYYRKDRQPQPEPSSTEPQKTTIVRPHKQGEQGQAPPSRPATGPPTSPITSPGRAGDGGVGSGAPPKPPVKQGKWVPPDDPKKPTFFEKIRLRLRRYGIKSLTRGSRNWLKDNVAFASKPPGRQRLIEEGQTAAEALIGKMFFYYYDAKTAKELPYWDKFPLIFVIELYKDGWLGLNLHYLDRTLRLKLFDKLLQFADDKTLDKIQKLRLSYTLLKGVSQYPEVRPCLKRYLASHVRSDLVTVKPLDWEIALFLPVEQFQKAKKEKVWIDSRDKVLRSKGRKRRDSES